MPKKLTRQQVQKLASQPSREDRLELFDYLAKLPDAGLIYHPPVTDPSSMVMPSTPTQDVLVFNLEMGWGVTSDGTRVFSVEGREVLSIKFNPANYAEFSYQKLKDKALILNSAGEGHDLLQQKIRTDYEKKGTALTDEQVNQIERNMLDWYAQKLLKDSLIELATTIDKNINQAAMAVLAKVVQIAGFSVANLLRDSVGVSEKLKVSDVQSIIYKPEWDRLKTIVGLQSKHGGSDPRIEVSDEQCATLSADYPDLLKHWQQVARTRNTKNRDWRGHAKLDMEDTPDDLLDRLDDDLPGQLEGDYPNLPSALAHEHAARRAKIPDNEYGLSQLGRLRRRGDKVRGQRSDQDE